MMGAFAAQALKRMGFGGVLAWVLVFMMSAVSAWMVFEKLSLEVKLAQEKAFTSELRAAQQMSRSAVAKMEEDMARQIVEIAKFRVAVDDKDEEVRAAEERANRIQARHVERLAELAGQQGASCEEGIALIDRELGL